MDYLIPLGNGMNPKGPVSIYVRGAGQIWEWVITFFR